MATVPQLHLRAELKLHPEVHVFEDEWSGITDPKVRRKLQNRLNQRAARRRKAAQKNGGDVGSSSSDSSPAAAISDMPLQQRANIDDMSMMKRKSITSTDWNATAEPLHKRDQSAFVSIRCQNPYQYRYDDLVGNGLVSFRELEERLGTDQDTAWMYPLTCDHLISLIYYNVYRALISNVQMLGLDLNLMNTDEYPSPFLPLSPTSNSHIRNLPPSLQPTELQKTVAHHPQFDVFPDPVVRDNILRYGEENIDDYALCFDMTGGCALDENSPVRPDTQSNNGLIVWSDPWDPDGWEATETFIRKWPFLFRGALRSQRATNKWRMLRGEAPLDFPRILEIE